MKKSGGSLKYGKLQAASGAKPIKVGGGKISSFFKDSVTKR